MKGDPLLPPRDGWKEVFGDDDDGGGLKLTYLFDVDGGQEEDEGVDFLDD